MWPGEEPTEILASQQPLISVFHFGLSSLVKALRSSLTGEKLHPYADDSPMSISIPDVQLPPRHSHWMITQVWSNPNCLD